MITIGKNRRGDSVVSISCGGNHNFAQTRSGHLYSWGFGETNCLGHGVDRDEPEPKRVSFSKAGVEGVEVVQAVGGGQHSMLIGKVLNVR